MIRYVLELGRILHNHKLPRDKLEALREQRLRAVIRNAYDHVPYYRSLFRSADLSPDDIRSVRDLKKVPITTKEDIRAAGLKQMIADWANLPSLVSARTSGSTGEPLTVYRSASEHTIGWALHLATLIELGIRPTDRFASLGITWRKIPPWMGRFLRIYKSTAIPLNLSPDEQIRRLVEFQPAVIHTMPSVLVSLIHNLDYPLSDVIRPRIVMPIGEVFDDVLRNRIKAEVDADFLNSYGAVELGHMAWECPSHEGLHLNSDHFILEFLEGEAPSPPGGARVAVVTSLYAFAMPFIRYELGDLCAFTQRECSCGSPLPLIDYPLGRKEDMVRLPSGKMLSARRFDHLLRVFSSVLKWQVLQLAPHQFLVKLIVDGPTDDEMLHRIRAQFMEYLQEPVSIDIQLVDSMEEGTGRFRTFISRVPASSE